MAFVLSYTDLSRAELIYSCYPVYFGYSSAIATRPSQLKVEMQRLSLSKKSVNVILETIKRLRGSVSNGYYFRATYGR